MRQEHLTPGNPHWLPVSTPDRLISVSAFSRHFPPRVLARQLPLIPVYLVVGGMVGSGPMELRFKTEQAALEQAEARNIAVIEETNALFAELESMREAGASGEEIEARFAEFRATLPNRTTARGIVRPAPGS